MKLKTKFSLGKVILPGILACGLAAPFSAVQVSSAHAQASQADFDKMMEAFLSSDKGAQKIADAMQAHFQKRQQRAAETELEEQFKNPVKIDIGASPVKGPKDAKVTIIEFSDFECPFCKRGNDTMAEVAKLYPKDVKIVFKNLPLPGHANAEPAAKAALAANNQGKFWEFQDALFNNQRNLNDAKYVEIATELKLDLEKFNKDRASAEIAAQVAADAEIAKKHGITGTPAFFVNGVAVKGAYPVGHFKMIIDRWLAGGASASAAKKDDAGSKS